MRHIQDHEAFYRRVDFPVYGLDLSWPGPRWVGETGGRQVPYPAGWKPGDPLPPSRPGRFGLAHGEPWEGPQLRVTSWHQSEFPYEGVASSFAGHLGLLDTHPPDGGSTESYAEIERRAQALDWQLVSLPVDGVAVPFLLLRNGDDWGAYSQSPDHRITLQAYHGFGTEDVVLVTLTDAMPYIEGSRAQWRKS
jgi:hypothetical protein